jgi:phospholipid/cholesterol/gamma-HCH transport system substrate-binding protein
MTINRRNTREGLSGLLIVAGVAVGVGMLLWVNNFKPGGNRYNFSVEFQDANGLAAGVPVRLRGVNIGQVLKVTPSLEKVVVDAVVDNEGVILPLKARYTVGQKGLIGETYLEILPETGAKKTGDFKEAFATDCAKTAPTTSGEHRSLTVVCPGDLLTGETPTRVQDLITSLNIFANRINGSVLDDLQTTVKEIGVAAHKFGEIATEVKTTTRQINTTARAFTKVASSADKTLADLGKVGTNVGEAANEITATVRDNRARLASTLDNLSKISGDLSKLTPVLAKPEFANNLAALAENAAESAANLRKISGGLSDPATIDSLRETLDAARSTFRNAEKISTDLNDITGDPKFRANLKKLVEGLGQLISTSEQRLPEVRKVSALQ